MRQHNGTHNMTTTTQTGTPRTTHKVVSHHNITHNLHFPQPQHQHHRQRWQLNESTTNNPYSFRHRHDGSNNEWGEGWQQGGTRHTTGVNNERTQDSTNHDWQRCSDTCLPTLVRRQLPHTQACTRTRTTVEDGHKQRNTTPRSKMGLHAMSRTTNRHTVLHVWRAWYHPVSNKTGRTRLWHQVQWCPNNDTQQRFQRTTGTEEQPLLPSSNNYTPHKRHATSNTEHRQRHDSNDCPNNKDDTRIWTSAWRKKRLLGLQQWGILGEIPQNN